MSQALLVKFGSQVSDRALGSTELPMLGSEVPGGCWHGFATDTTGRQISTGPRRHHPDTGRYLGELGQLARAWNLNHPAFCLADDLRSSSSSQWRIALSLPQQGQMSDFMTFLFDCNTAFQQLDDHDENVGRCPCHEKPLGISMTFND